MDEWFCYTISFIAGETLMGQSILAISADTKTIKGEKKGYLTGILYLAPHTLSGFQVCPKASDGCKLACLNTAGRGIYNRTQQARIKKTQWFFQNRESFMEALFIDINKLIRKANKAFMLPAVRLNGTSDIAWEKIGLTINGIKYKNIFEAFPDVMFYDYTKILKRNISHIPNYYLTFSLTENNDKEAIKAIDMGMNLAVVMNTKRKESKPIKWSGFNVIDGDEHDVRFLDKKRVVVALTAKGKARYDTSGFVRNKTGDLHV